MIYLKQSTASQEIPLGYFLDSSDGDTEETGLTIANTDIKLWKAGATTLANKNSGGATHISNGVYYATLDATDTNTLGSLVVFVHVTGALAIKQECVVLAANIYDSWIAATDNLEVDTVAISGDTTAADNAELDYDGTGYTKTNSTIGTCTTNTDMRGTDSALLAASVNVSGGVVESNLTQMGGVAQSATDLKDFADAGYDPATNKIEGVKLVDTTTTNTDMVAEAPTAADNADAVWDEAKAGHVGVGSFGEEVQLHSLSTEISALNDFDPANDTVANVTTVGTCTTNTDMRGTDSAALAATALTNVTWTDGRAGYLDNLNIAENVAGTSEIAALNNLSAAQVNAEVSDVMKTDTIAEQAQGIPPATPTFEEAVMYLYMMLRNQVTVTSASKTFANNAGTVVWKKALSDDGTTYTEAKGASGP